MLLAQLPQPEEYEFIGSSAVVLVILSMLLLFVFLAAFLWFGWWVTNRHGNPCPYNGLKMRRGSDIVFSAVQQVQEYMTELNSPDNPSFNLRRAAICSETGRIFPNCVTIFGVIKVGWSFLKKRQHGHWVSWGSLSSEHQEMIRRYHRSLEGFQTEHSSSSASPLEVDAYHANIKPGPLYVDVETKVLMGWKCIPDTLWEVLIVQHPLLDPDAVYDDIVKAKKRTVEKK